MFADGPGRLNRHHSPDGLRFYFYLRVLPVVVKIVPICRLPGILRVGILGKVVFLFAVGILVV